MATVTQPGGHHAQRFTVDDGLRDGYEDTPIPHRRQRGEEHLATFVQVAGIMRVDRDLSPPRPQDRPLPEGVGFGPAQQHLASADPDR
jgi:hypothetical protein